MRKLKQICPICGFELTEKTFVMFKEKGTIEVHKCCSQYVEFEVGIECKGKKEMNIPKAEIEDTIAKSLSYHKDQMKVNEDVAPVVAHSHEIIIDFIETELKERIDDL